MKLFYELFYELFYKRLIFIRLVNWLKTDSEYSSVHLAIWLQWPKAKPRLMKAVHS